MGILIDLIDLPALEEGRIGFSLSQLSGATLALPGVAERVVQARAAADATTEVRVLWSRARSQPTARGRAAELDAQIDRALGSIATITQSLMRGLPADDPTHQAAKALLDLALPEGAGPVASLAYEAELNYVRKMLQRVEAAGDLAARAGVAPVIATLTRLVPLFEAELSARPELMEYSVLREHEAEMRRAYAAVVVQIAAAFLDPGQESALKGALAPILEQVERVRQARRDRKAVRDVDPQSGVEVEPTVS